MQCSRTDGNSYYCLCLVPASVHCLSQKVVMCGCCRLVIDFVSIRACCTCPNQGCNMWRNRVKLPPFCSQPVAALAECQQRPERWRTEVLDFCTGSHKSSSFTRRKSRTSNNPVPVLRIPSKCGWMSCSLNESNLNQLRHKLQP